MTPDGVPDWDALVGWARERFDRVDTIPALVIPWGDDRDDDDHQISGLMVDRDERPDGRPAWRIGIYDDLVCEHLAMAYVDTVDDAVDTVEYLTEMQPEGTDWASWAAQRVKDTEEWR